MNSYYFADVQRQAGMLKVMLAGAPEEVQRKARAALVNRVNRILGNNNKYDGKGNYRLDRWVLSEKKA